MATCPTQSVCKQVKETCKEMCQLHNNLALHTISLKKKTEDGRTFLEEQYLTFIEPIGHTQHVADH
eukprot:7201026-Heterocapsa_arctica.AAC.1